MTIFEIKDFISISSAGFETSEESLEWHPLAQLLLSIGHLNINFQLMTHGFP